MNKQIHKLRFLAAEYANLQKPLGVTMWSEVRDEKFALLIIKECIGVVSGGSFLHDAAPDAIFAKECSRAIEKHFGIE